MNKEAKTIEIPQTEEVKATTTDDNNSKFIELLAKVNKEIKDIKDIDNVHSPQYLTNGIFNKGIDIHDSTNLDLIVKITAKIIRESKDYREAAHFLGLPLVPVFKWQNFTAESWLNDLKIRSAIISQKEHKANLEKDKAKLEALLTQQEKKAMVIAEMSAKYGL